MEKLKELLKKRYIRFLFLAASGVMTGLTVCFNVLGILEWITMIPAALVFYSLCDSEKNRLRSFYSYGLFFSMCYFVTTWHWFFSMYPMSYTGMTEFAAFTVLLAAVLGLPLLQSSSFAFVFVIAGLIARGKLAEKFKILSPLAVAAVWSIFEWMQTLFWFGVPWGRLSIGQAGILVTAQTASWFGCYFITFLLVSVNFLLGYAIYNTETRKLFAVAAAGLFAFNTLSGAVLMATDGLGNSGRTVKVAAIQGNISSSQKWDSLNWFSLTTESYAKLTREAAEKGAQIVVWPETVFPVFIENSYNVSEFVSELAKECNVTLLVGTITAGDDNGQYNSIVTVMPDGSFSNEVYYKQRLVPFGEYLPWSEFISAIIPALAEVNMLENFTTAPSDYTVTSGEGAVIGSAICFDSIYEELARNSVNEGAEMIAIETNDSWFFDSAAVHMHLSQARLRAIENGRYVARAANTGISAIISSTGQIIDECPALETGYVIGDIQLREQKTLYTYVGNIIIVFAALFCATVITVDVREKIKKRRESRNEAAK